ncbi:uncharacterized protein LOC124117578 [Haliotis rufescens]|uniref:uncharacterized protein LOC124117578 n=1 Tax=Haliotis rufescens TaxID=6454 RepID=UPI00201F5A16|nr:uncharacterized protein LOC124117578 [Haliotis rufescens]
MPRKGSRKSILEKKPKLDFVKSPVSGPGCPVSPVLGALHPLTAKAIAADESNLTWISPNFLARQGLSHGKIKLLRGKRLQTRQRHVSGEKENHGDSRRGQALGRLKPLAFLTDDATDESLELLQSLTPPRDFSVSRNLCPSPTSDVQTPEMKENAGDQRQCSDSSVLVRRQLRKGDNSSHKSIADTVCKAPNLIESPLRILNFSVEDSQCCDPSQIRRSARLREKYKDSVKLLRTPPRRVVKDANVLVVDTPESDYGLSLRRRQLAKLRGCVSGKTS